MENKSNYNDLKLKAYAKVNLGLNIERKRPDGYHDIDTIMTRICLYDEVSLAVSKKHSHTFSISLSKDLQKIYNEAELSKIKENSPIFRVAEYIAQEYNTPCVDVNIIKSIPFRAGLGGSATDTAAVAYGMTKLFDLNEIPESVLLKFGADVPFFYSSYLSQNIKRIKGIGNVLKSLPAKKLYLAILFEGNGVNTKEAFEVYDRQGEEKADIDKIEEYILNKIRFDEIDFKNSLENSAIFLSPDLYNTRAVLNEAGFSKVFMTGSGSSFIGLEEEKYVFEKKVKLLEQMISGNNMFLAKHSSLA